MNIVTNILGEWVWPLLQFLIGVGLVIFVHELGHFLMAKAVNIKVEKFAMGIGPRLWGFRRGETEYCLNLLLPLGGYVKMLGQDDVRPPVPPGQAAAGAGAAPANPASAATEGESPAAGRAAADDPVTSPRAYQNKTIGQRMLVISGGVVMNVIFGILLFVIVGMVGKPFPASVVGGVAPGSPAAEAAIAWETTAPPPSSAPGGDANVGLRPGDEIIRITGDRFFLKLIDKSVNSFEKLVMVTLLANADDRYSLTFKRQAGGRTFVGVATMGVRDGLGEAGEGRKGFGIISAGDTVFDRTDTVRAVPIQPGDRLVSLAGTPVAHAWDMLNVIDRLDGNAIPLIVQRDGKRQTFDIQPVLGWGGQRDIAFDRRTGERLLIEPNQEPADAPMKVRRHDGNFVELRSADANYVKVRSADGRLWWTPLDGLASGGEKEALDIMGMLPRLQVEGVTNDSPADRAGMKPGDIIYEYGDIRGPTRQQLNRVNAKAAGTGTNLVLLRGDKLVGPLKVTPRKAGKSAPALLGFVPVPEMARAVIADVREGSPAASAGLRGGDVVREVNGRHVESWIDVFRAVRQDGNQALLLQVRRGEAGIEANLGPATADFFDANDYRFNPLLPPMEPLQTTIRKGPVAAVGWGVEQSWEFIISQYAWLRQLVAGQASPRKDLAGPLMLGQAAVFAARKGPMYIFYLMAVISACVAVINFLPFPVLDGGHAAMLILEKVRGRPLPVKVQWGLQVFGLACLLALFAFVVWNDLSRMLGW
jgi:regulator of sigma E protease